MPPLGPRGLALAFPEGPASDMFGKLGREYGAALPDATVRIATAARRQGTFVVATPLESKLYVPDLRSEMQAILNEAGLQAPVAAAFAAVTAQLPAIRARTRQALVAAVAAARSHAGDARPASSAGS